MSKMDPKWAQIKGEGGQKHKIGNIGGNNNVRFLQLHQYVLQVTSLPQLLSIILSNLRDVEGKLQVPFVYFCVFDHPPPTPFSFILGPFLTF